MQFHSVFVKLDEYNKNGMIHISEISPGRIRNIRDFVKEDKVIVCKVLRINKERGHIDLSLRRVNENQRRGKINEVKQEQKAEKILEFVAKDNKIKTEELFDKINPIAMEEHGSLYEFFEEVVDDKADFKKFKLDKHLAEQLEEIVRQRIKPPIVDIEGTLSATLYEKEGVEIIKKAFSTIKGTEGLDCKYLGGGKYQFRVESDNYKDAELILKEAVSKVEKVLAKADGVISFNRD